MMPFPAEKVDDRVNSFAALANATIYDSEATRHYVEGAPHLKHAALRELYGRLVLRAYDHVAANNHPVTVLDLGAGEGSATRVLLELGAQVTAVDVSESQLQALQCACANYQGLEVCQAEAIDALQQFQAAGRRFDLVVALSFLHHIPDYLEVIRNACALLTRRGTFFSFQDPLKYDRLDPFVRSFGFVAYYSWRVLQGDVVGGAKRRLRRTRGIYLAQSPEDNVEYHVIRGGVDQQAIVALFQSLDFQCEIVPYFSTQSRFWQALGSKLGLKNTFAVLARARSDS